MYRLGDPDYSENIEIKICGSLTKGFFKGDKFKGDIIIGGKERPEIEFFFDDSNKGLLYFYDEYTGKYEWFSLFSKDMEEEITICVLENDEHRSGWSDKDGLMISAPANNRDEALEISNRLMKRFVDSFMVNKLK